MASRLINPEQDQRASYSGEFKASVFQAWYSNEEPPANVLLDILGKEGIFDQVTGYYLNENTLSFWISTQFPAYAAVLDSQFVRQMDSQLVEAKVQMVKRHLEVMGKLQDKAWEYIDAHGLENSRNAITALFKAVAYEREARGLPVGAFEKISEMTDEELEESFKELVAEVELNASPKVEV